MKTRNLITGLAAITGLLFATVFALLVPSALAAPGSGVTISTTGPAADTVLAGADDVPLLNFTIETDMSVTFENFPISLHALEGNTRQGLLDGSTANLTDIKIINVNNGAVVAGPIDSDEFVKNFGRSFGIPLNEYLDNRPADYLFTDDFTMKAGETLNLAITADIESSSLLNGMRVRAAVDMDRRFPRMKDDDNNVLRNFLYLSPWSAIYGNFMTIEAPALEINLSSSVVSKDVGIGAEDEELVAFTFTASDVSDIVITDLTLTGYIDDDGDTGTLELGEDGVRFNEVVTAVRLYHEEVTSGRQLAADESAASNGEILFSGLSWEIPAGETELLIVTGDFASDMSFDSDQIKVDIADASADVPGYDADGNYVEAIGDAENGGGSSTDGAVLTVVAGGTLGVQVSADTPLPQIVVAGESNVEFAEFKFTAADESFVISEIAFENDYGSTAGDYDDNLKQIAVEYYTDEAQTVAETIDCAPVITGLVTCSGMAMMVPDPDLASTPDYALLTVLVDLYSSDHGPADPGDKPALNFTSLDDFEAVGQDTGAVIYETSLVTIGAMETNFMQVQATDIDVAVSSSARTGTVDSAEEILSLWITADPAEEADIDSLTVDLLLSENWASTSVIDADLYQNGMFVTTCPINYTDVDAAEIDCSISGVSVPNGETDDFSIELDTASLISDDSYDTELLMASVDLGNVDTVGDIIWSDQTDILDFCGVNSTDQVYVVSSY